MTFGQTIRRALFGLAVLACLVSWGALGASLLLDLDRGYKIAAVIAAAVTTEAALWLGAVLLGWTAFANRARLWKKLTGAA